MDKINLFCHKCNTPLKSHREHGHGVQEIYVFPCEKCQPPNTAPTGQEPVSALQAKVDTLGKLPEKLLAIAALALMVDKGDIFGMTELDFCIAHDLEQEYFDGESWLSLFAQNYKAAQQTLTPDAQYLCERCGHPESEHPTLKCLAFARH